MAVVLTASAPTTLNSLKRQRFRRLCSKNGDSIKSFRPKGRVVVLFAIDILACWEDELWVFLEQCLQGNYEDYVDRCNARCSDPLAHGLSGERLPLVPEKNVLENKPDGLFPANTTLSALMLHYARNGLFSKALGIWDELVNSSFVPDSEVVSQLIFIYGSIQDFNMVTRILHEMQLKDVKLMHNIFSLAISYFGRSGQLDCMEFVIKEMVSMGYSVDSVTGNAYILYYCAFGSLADIEAAYGRLKRSRILIEEEAIRAISFAYIKKTKFFALGRFVHDVGLGRRNVGNLLWNLLLLSYAANFKMKSLQREFVRMVEAGFSPDLNTFNIRSLAFSKMSLLWDLHLSLDHMKHEGVVPDLVTYGCVVDVYLDKKLGRNLNFALSKLNSNDSVLVLTDPLVFEAMGKGDFHLSSDAIIEYTKKKDWTYKMLISVYLKKKFRSNQIFWNY
ncbi:Pentatricopeptide repeat superfamily protein [Perilla frutescens var. hirtella]|uniref:Pentatricopeptide repeat superfamily protein n=1 Tax=Perilla frutescens var. hirtella TaxID=608512 RepID=A0AAD4J2I0_PERFH|nr:Pentatricopeptide repeat superfamily protein [Perilla frutescens var. hirtella]